MYTDARPLPRIPDGLSASTASGFRYRTGPEGAARDRSRRPRRLEVASSVIGAGKSTIAKLLGRYYDPQEGVITIDGVDLREVTQESFRRQLGVVPQEGFLFAGTVHENIAHA